MRHRKVTLPFLAAVVLTSSAALVACSGDSSQPAAHDDSESVGSVGLDLQAAQGVTLTSVSYTITGPGSFSKTGSIDVTNSTKIAATISPIPAGAGYSITLSANSVEGNTSCSGSAGFDVVARQTTPVTVRILCHEAARTGSVLVNGQLNLCPVIDGVSATPGEVLVGHTIALSADAHDSDAAPSALSYHWTASSGSLSDASAKSPTFTCTTAGSATLTVTAADGDPAASCADTGSVTVQCTSGATSACTLGKSGAIKHVIYIQFDNTHLTRDRAAVPSDLEQMPHLLSFIRSNGTMMANDHTVLISHTAGGILSSLTGVYPDRNGQTVSNSYVRTSDTGTFQFPSSFGYWTDPASATTALPNMVGPDGSNIPAPWVNYTRAGCDVGAIATANVVLENTGIGPSGDVTKVFGPGSPQFIEAQASAAAASGSAARNKAQTDLVGFAVHCAAGSTTCATGQDDLLPTEPGGYTGFKGLFGAQAINPLLTGQPATVALNDLMGRPIVDPFNQPGFPGFDGMSAATSLAYIASMQEKGIPVTYAYISDAHDNHGTAGNAHTAFGPGSAGYVQQLADYDAAFAAFFTRLDADGINKTNTLFVFTVDEGDHFVGDVPSPATCDGVTTACDWTGHVGEINANIDTLVSHQLPTVASKFLGTGPNAFTVHGDDAPTFYLAKKGAGALTQHDPDARDFERQIAGLTAVNPYTGHTDKLLVAMADQSGLKGLHMITTGDPARNPTFSFFADANYFITDFPASTCETCIQTGFAWNHGDIQPEIAQTWLGFVGPGVLHQADQTVFTDHTDVRPTINAILGLCDAYELDGRVITQALDSSAYPSALASNPTDVANLGASYKRIDAPFGDFAASILVASTNALQADDATYTSIEGSIDALVTRQGALAALMRTALDRASCHNQAISSTQAQDYIAQAEALVADAVMLASSSSSGTGGGGSGAGGSSGAASGGGSGAGGGSGSGGVAGLSSGGTAGTSGSAGAAGSAGSSGGSTTAHLDIYRVGDGSSALVNTGNPVFIDEVLADGSAVRSIPMPLTINGANHRLVASGTATSEGLISRSADGHFVMLTGYDAPLPTTGLAATTGSAVPRIIGRLAADGSVDTSTQVTDGASGNNPRSVASSDGGSIWFTGASGGVRFLTLGNAGSTTTVSTTVANLRQLNIFGLQLYVSDSSGSAVRLGTVGTGLPTTAGQTITNLPGFPLGGSPYGFYLADLDAGVPGVDTLYVADDGLGLTKYSLVAGSWTASGTVGTATDAYRGLTAIQDGTTVTLFATRKGGSAAAGGGELVSLVDATGYEGAFAATPTLLLTATTNTALRGVALAPTP